MIDANYFAGKKIVYAVYAQMTIDIIFKHHQEIYCADSKQ